MKCAAAKLFFDRMYREGNRFDRPDIIAHVNQCGRCRRDYEQWCGIARKLEDAPAPLVPPALYSNVLRAIGAQKGNGRIMRFPLQWKMLPYGIASAALLLIAAISFVIVQPRIDRRHMAVITPESPAAPVTEVMTHFEISLTDARRVALVGDFNAWNRERHLLVKKDADTWEIDLPIPKGCYQYLFLVDGEQWETDPSRAQHVPDGFGGLNTVIEL
jgi:hypothetical protein